MTDEFTAPRRAFLQTGAGTLALAGLAGLGVSSAATTATLPGLKPLYSRHGQAQSQALDSPAASDLPDAAVRALRRLTFGYRPEDLTA
ncbi:MAG TPA: hypothetical protein VJN01_05360, partial [Xanthomonadales bacterium]|nr:hypothetical protein [Xanthomonadales bacterium]